MHDQILIDQMAQAQSDLNIAHKEHTASLERQIELTKALENTKNELNVLLMTEEVLALQQTKYEMIDFLYFVVKNKTASKADLKKLAEYHLNRIAPEVLK